MTDTIRTIKQVGGALCLDFCNTADWEHGAIYNEWMPRYADVLEWAARAGILTAEDGNRLQSTLTPDVEAGRWEETAALRHLLRRIFSALAQGHPVETDALQLLTAWLHQMHTQRVLGADLHWRWCNEPDDWRIILWQVLESAEGLLHSEQRQWVRMCPGDQCGWLFADTSKNHRRQWCDMSDCGNRAKARRFYDRRSRPPR
jgi:predicted RNA-binding Zn ribbon-like protein